MLSLEYVFYLGTVIGKAIGNFFLLMEFSKLLNPGSFCGNVRVFWQHNILQLFHECDRCTQQSIESAPTGSKALPTEALVPSPYSLLKYTCLAEKFGSASCTFVPSRWFSRVSPWGTAWQPRIWSCWCKMTRAQPEPLQNMSLLCIHHEITGHCWK